MDSKAKAYYDNRHQKAPQWKKGEKVFLLQWNIKMKQPCDKLNHKKLGLFKIKKQLGTLNYKLELLKTMKIHPIFHVALLEKAPQNIKYKKVEMKPEMEYEIERILDHNQIEGKEHYLVKWKEYSLSENTWEPIGHLWNAQMALQKYQQQQQPAENWTIDPERIHHLKRSLKEM